MKITQMERNENPEMDPHSNQTGHMIEQRGFSYLKKRPKEERERGSEGGRKEKKKNKCSYTQGSHSQLR